MRSRSGFLGRGLLCILVLACPAAVLAQQGWGATPAFVSNIATTGTAIHSARVGIDAAGNAISVWTQPNPTGLPVTVVMAARYDKSSNAWGPPTTLSASGSRFAGPPTIAVDAAGNAVVAWLESPLSLIVIVRASRYDVSTGIWTPVTLDQTTSAIGVRVAMTPTGSAAIVWSSAAPPGSFARRYSATGGWSAPEPVGDVGTVAGVGIDGVGNVHVVGLGSVVRAVSFTITSGAWGAAIDLSGALPMPGTPSPGIAVNAAGDAVATWSRNGFIEAARRPAGAGSWTAALPISTGGATFEEGATPVIDGAGNITVPWMRTTTVRTVQVARWTTATQTWSVPLELDPVSMQAPLSAAADSFGNVFVIWSRLAGAAGLRMIAARYSIATGVWTLAPDLSADGQRAWNSDVAMNARGDAMAVWFQQAGGLSVTQALPWVATPAAPVVNAVTPSTGTVSVSLNVPPGSDSGFASGNLEYSLDGGTSWVTRNPAGVSSPLAITGLTDGVTYALAIRAVNAAGPGAISAPLQVRAGSGGTSPTDFRVAARRGNLLTFAWVAPAAGFVPNGYEIEGGIAGQVLATIPTGGAATQFSVTAPDGTFFVRVVATAGTLRSAPSNEIVVTVGGAVPPSRPQNLLASKNGPTIALSWTTVFDQGVPTEMSLLVGGAPTLLSARLPPGEAATFAELPGRFAYGFTLSAVTAAGSSAPSNSVNLMQSSTCGGAPGAPRAFSASTQGGVAYLDWLPPSAGEAVAGYLVTVSGAFTGSFAMPARTLAVPVPSGRYTVSVASTGLCGNSAPTPAQTIVVP